MFTQMYGKGFQLTKTFGNYFRKRASKVFNTMLIMSVTAKQIIDYRKLKKLSRQQLADKLGVTVRTVSNWENGSTIPKSAEILIENLFNKSNSLLVQKNNDQHGIPILPGVHTTGSVVTLFKDEHNEEPLFYLDAPQIKGCDYGVVVTGSSMYPLIPNGSYVACKTILDKDHILYGEIYHVITGDYSTVKYVHPHPTKEDWVLLVPYSDSAKPTPMPKEKIIKISQVRAILQVI